MNYGMMVVSSTNTRRLSEIILSMKNHPGWAAIPAVKENRAYAIANDIEYCPRAYLGLVWTAQLLHPDEFRDRHPRLMRTDYEDRYVSVMNTTTVIYP